MLIEQIASDQVLYQAFAWVCDSRAHYHFNGDIWHLRRWWQWVKGGVDGLVDSVSFLLDLDKICYPINFTGSQVLYRGNYQIPFP
uniref:Uncharacterized protein n=1 Tax=Moorena producens (strain JHB) TaxID=1454205 RepID=A0A1D9G735_MOOP1